MSIGRIDETEDSLCPEQNVNASVVLVCCCQEGAAEVWRHTDDDFGKVMSSYFPTSHFINLAHFSNLNFLQWCEELIGIQQCISPPTQHAHLLIKFYSQVLASSSSLTAEIRVGIMQTKCKMHESPSG